MPETTDPTGRDELDALSRAVLDALRTAWRDEYSARTVADGVADAILAAGWGREVPRPVTVSEEAIEAALEAWGGRAIQDIEASPREHVTDLLEAALPHLSSGQSEADLRAERDELRAVVEQVRELARECQGLVSRYTRAYGENGDRVADLLSEDTYQIGTEILALLPDTPNDERSTT